MPTRFDEAKFYDELAPRFRERVITPFAKGVDFRLPTDVRRILKGWREARTCGGKVVIDLGCGIGDGLALMAGKVGLVAGVDFSSRMLDESQKRLERKGIPVLRLNGPTSLRSLRRLILNRRRSSPFPATSALASGNLLRLEALAGACDCALAINAIGTPSVAKAYRMFSQVAACLRPRGVLLSAFPSLDTMFHLHQLQRKDHVDPPLLDRIDRTTGIYTEVTGLREKFFLPDEIRQLCCDNDLLVERLEKIRYPWSYMARLGWGYYPRSPRIWDWYLVARRK